MEVLKREETCEDRERRAERATKIREEEERLLSEAQEKRFLAEKHSREFLEQMKEAELNAKKIEQAKEDARSKMRELDQLFSEKKLAIEQAEHALKKTKVEREQIKEELDARGTSYRGFASPQKRRRESAINNRPQVHSFHRRSQRARKTRAGFENRFEHDLGTLRLH